MKRIVVLTGVLFTLTTPHAIAMEIGTDDEPMTHLAAPRQSLDDRLAENDAAGAFSPAAPIDPLPYRGSIGFRPASAFQSSPVYRHILTLFFVSEITENHPLPSMRLALGSQLGLQWSPDGQRPSLEYRFSDNAAMRLRGSRQGARLLMNWKF
jgi:hypothetical protein